MFNILLPYAVFLFLGQFLEFLGLSYGVSYAIKTLVTLGIIAYFWKSYNFKFKWSWFGFGAGISIFIIWIGIDGLYPLIGEPTMYEPENLLFMAFRLIGAVLAASLVEELFTRGFLIRYLVNPNWRKVKFGVFTWPSFLITVFFFGLSHNRWLAGLLSAVIFNMVYYREKSLEPCILAHSVANLALAIYVITTGQWNFW